MSVTRSKPNPDVLIVGSGPTGAVAAKRLAEAGFEVVCLEQGDWPDHSKARAREDDFELTAPKEWSWLPNVRQAPGDYPIEESESDISPVMGNNVGGSSLYYAAAWHRNLPSDFCVRSLDGVADDWPMTYDELVPYYERVERDFAVSGLGGDPAYPPGSTAPPLPPAPLNAVGLRVARAHNELGWHWWPSSCSIATRKYGNLNACVQLAACPWGCPQKAKATVDLTHWPVAQELGVELIAGARVTRIEVDSRGLATGATWVDREGREHFQRASVTILAANGVGTPRLLLASANGSHPDGLANSSGLVGRRLMMHPYGTVVGLFEDALQSWQGSLGQLAYSLQFYETDESRGFVRGAKWQLAPTGGPLSMTRRFPWGYDNSIWEGGKFHEEFAQRFGRSAFWAIFAEDLPDELNRVVLDPEITDESGIPAAKIIYKTSNNSRRLLDFHIERAKESFEAAGAYRMVSAPQIREAGWHLLGTTKMGNDPENSVVDRWGKTHDVPNLYVFDGSVWPTSAGVNPVATIAALSLYFSDHLISGRRNQEVPR
jgi:choline dehydrogenase-like flavoprotein